MKRILFKTIFFIVCLFLCAVSFYYMLPRNSPDFEGVYSESITHFPKINKTSTQSYYVKKVLTNEFRTLTDSLLLNSNLFAVKLKHRDIVELVDSMLWMYNIYFFYTDSTCLCCQKLATTVTALLLKYGIKHVRVIGIPLKKHAVEDGNVFNIFYTPKKNSIKKFKNIAHWLKPLPGIYIQDNYSSDGIFVTHNSEDFNVVETRLSFYFEWLTRVTEKNLKNMSNKKKITDNATIKVLLGYKKINLKLNLRGEQLEN